MYSFYRNLKPLYRRLIHTVLILIIALIPTIFRTPENMPPVMMTLWIIAFFSEAIWILVGHKVNMDYGELNLKAVKKIEMMKPEKKGKKARELQTSLKNLVISNPGIRMKRDEDCIFKGEASGIRDPKVIKAYLGDDAPEGIEDESKDSCSGLLYITTERMIFEGARNRFNLRFDEIRQAQQYGKSFIIYTSDFPYVVETKNSKDVIYAINIINQYNAAIEN